MEGLIKNVKAVVEEVFGCPGAIDTKTRRRFATDARMAYVKLLSNYATYLSNTNIGASINRDHTAVWYYLNKHEDLFAINDLNYITKYNACDAIVKGFCDVKPDDYREMLQEKVQMLSQRKCEGLLTLLENYI